MNKTKRNLELASAIVSIVLCSFWAFIFLICLGSMSIVEEMLIQELQAAGEYDAAIIAATLEMVNMVFIVFLIIFVVMIIMGAFLAKSPMKNGVVSNRTGLAVTFLVFNGLIALFMLSSSPLVGLLFAVPFGLGLASVCMKHRPTYFSINDELPSDF